MKSYSKAEQVYKRYKDSSFNYGSADCCTVTRDLIEAFHGINVKGYSIDYDGSPSSIRMQFKKAGVRSLGAFLEYLALENQWKPIYSMRHLQPFDVLLVRQGRRDLVAVWTLDRVVSMGESGICELPDSIILKAYRPGGE